ncbi:tRNA-dependent cyclodipeptide synthase [Erwiniaceae bacterium BAC15a-03b]|uniref:Cyclodipeptide synthase n=1 Tax=Winslowiella arboricola TaxID=2978220 RepID=A0A9J6PJI7_9GAMM|nr:tRNA-dependent cyclodipeptide synthase [Winslowiella arboricola]MCU5771215.1 tRNA-dependent cyclodipeptide synthase [Winslowiella arboricola]MCU5777522.1 tRNA-dependent cyclodipeptide synthase [Winslowiella arboricola]
MEIASSSLLTANGLTGTRYRASTAQVFPAHLRESIVSGGASRHICFLGVSLENKNFENNRLSAMLEWIAKRFVSCKILVGDSIHRITLEATKGMPPDQALAHGLKLGQKFIAENEQLIYRFQHKVKCEFITCSEIQKHKDYNRIRLEIDDYFAKSPDFRASIALFSRKYHEKNWQDLNPSELSARIRRSADYFLEEFAIFACLAREGIDVMVYPGTFSSLADIAEGKFPGVSTDLEQVKFVSLRLKGR